MKYEMERRDSWRRWETEAFSSILLQRWLENLLGPGFLLALSFARWLTLCSLVDTVADPETSKCW